jgi:hypothetical protein
MADMPSEAIFHGLAAEMQVGVQGDVDMSSPDPPDDTGRGSADGQKMPAKPQVLS